MPSRSSKSRKASTPKSPAREESTRDTASKKADLTSSSKAHPTPRDLHNHILPILPTIIQQTPTLPPPNWPSSLPYLTYPIISPNLPPSHHKWLHTRPQPQPNHTPELTLPVISFPLSQTDIQSRVSIQLIEDPKHPAHGQRGLFAARDLSPGELVVVYLGYVHGSTGVERAEMEKRRGGFRKSDGGGEVVTGLVKDDENSPTKAELLSHDTNGDAGFPEGSMLGSWDTSSYDLNMYREESIELAADAANMGNEARFVNDYRGVPVSTTPSDIKQGDDEISRDRKGKRRVKTESVYLDTTGDGNGDGNEWQSFEGKYAENIAMPNAEFRDVWFDIPEDTDLSIEGLMSMPGSSADESSQAQHRHEEDGHCVDAISQVKASHIHPPEHLHLNGAEQPRKTKDNNDSDKDIPPHPQSQSQPQDRQHLPRRKRKPGVRGVAIFVMPAGKSGKRKHGIKKGQEVLVSYGKGFWAHHGVDPY